MLPRLDLHLYAAPVETRSLARVSVNGHQLNTLEVDHIDQSLHQQSFDWLSARLSSLDRLHFEPDGSFVFSGEYLSRRWQLDGMVYDRNNRLQRIEISGTCPLAAWNQLLQLIGGRSQHMVAFLRTEKCLVDVTELNKLWGPT